MSGKLQNVDFLVVGAGAAGITVASQLQESGQNVVILEGLYS